MSVRLSMPREPYWIALGFGVRHRVRPASTALVATLKAKADRLAREMMDPVEAERLAGIMDAKDLSQEDLFAGLFRLYLAILVCQAATLEWEGYEDGDGNPLPVTDDNVAAAMRLPLISDAFLSKYFEPFAAAAEEGKGSGSSPNGTMAGGRPTAMDAASDGAKAATPAPTPETHRAPSKDRRQPKS